MEPYAAPFILFNAHLETIYPSLIRRVNAPAYERQRIGTPDEDFLDLDWLKQNSRRLVIISHGLEGNSTRPYVRGMAKAFFNTGMDVLAWNYRGCSEEMNHQLRFYHSGASDDLDVVVRHSSRIYPEIYLVGFSLGGNMTLKYLGERGREVPPAIRRAVAFSVPMDLEASCRKISRPENWLYSRRFLKSLKNKVIQKSKLKSEIDISGIEKIKDLLSFDNRYTAPIHGFKDAIHYYRQSSSLGFVDRITIPTLIVSAKNDPFLSPECYPADLLRNHPFVQFEAPEHGGHVGFTLFNGNGLYWSEQRALAFINS